MSARLVYKYLPHLLPHRLHLCLNGCPEGITVLPLLKGVHEAEGPVGYMGHMVPSYLKFYTLQIL